MALRVVLYLWCTAAACEPPPSTSRAFRRMRVTDARSHPSAALVYQTAFPALFYLVTAMAYGRALACVLLLLVFSPPSLALPHRLIALTQPLTARSKGESLAPDVKPGAAPRPVKV